MLYRHKKEAAHNQELWHSPILPSSSPTHSQYKCCLALHNKKLKEIGDKLCLPVRFTSYVIRHSWASTALQSGVSVAVISQGLGHSSEKTTRYYLSELDVSELTKANRIISAPINCLFGGGQIKTSPYLWNKVKFVTILIYEIRIIAYNKLVITMLS